MSHNGDSKLTSTEVIDDRVVVGKVSGGGVVIASGEVRADILTGGGVLISPDKVVVDTAAPAAGFVAAPEVTVKNGDVKRIPLKDVLDEDVETRIDSDLERISESKKRKVERIILNKDNFSESEENNNSNLSPVTSNASSHSDEKSKVSSNDDLPDSSPKNRPEEHQALDDIDLPEDEIAAVVVANVLDLFCTNTPQYQRDRRIMLDNHPELEPIMERASSVDDAIKLAEEHENLSFTDEQVRLMHKDESKVNTNKEEEIEFEELLY